MRRIYIGLFLVTLVTLGFEVLLTRLFSVATWYHFAFMAISIAMFGATAGAIAVYLAPRRFPQERIHGIMAGCSILFSITMIIALMLIVYMKFSTEVMLGVGPAGDSAAGIMQLTLIYVCVAVPFFFSGIIVTLALTRFPACINSLYAADLLGAALGCICVIFLLRGSDGPTSVFAFSAVAAFAAFLFQGGDVPQFRKVAIIYGLISLVLAVFTVSHTIATRAQKPLIRMKYAKGKIEEPPLWEKWNAFSRIRVDGNPNVAYPPAAWGPSTKYNPDPVRMLHLNIDGGAGTTLMNFDGDASKLKYLKYDIINLAQYLRKDARMMAIGAGGGRDLLSAFAFNQKSVTGVEINGAIITAVTNIFGDFTGHLDRFSTVTLVNDEARSFATRSKELFDLIQISLIDTWAASSAGAYVLTENSLYTVEAWRTFLNRLTPGGILTVSRWYNKLGPTECYRTVALAAEALKQNGVANPRANILVARTVDSSPERMGVLVGTIIVSNQAFSEQDLKTFQAVCDDLGFKPVLTPSFAEDKIFEALGSANLSEAAKHTPLKVSAPTDDSPFFHFVYLRDIFRPSTWKNEFFTFNLRAVVVLGVLLVIVTILTALCILLPLWLGTRRHMEGWRPGLPLLYFTCIGMGFMFVEISQMQRLIVFLGHPIYGLAVVLFVILSAAGIGSLAVQSISRRIGTGATMVMMLAALIAFGALAPMAMDAFRASDTPIRITVAGLLLAPVAFCLGFAFPIGMRMAHAHTPAATAWLWGVNGATSVLASVLAVGLGIFAGINATFWLGVAIYAIAVLLAMILSRKTSPDAEVPPVALPAAA